MGTKKGLLTTFGVSIVFLLFLEVVFSDLIKELIVPPYSVRHSNVTLECHYDLNGESLYSLQWYHNNRKIYKYEPASTPQIVVSPYEKVHVLESKSTPEKLVLKAVDLSATGAYKCEVILGWPDFLTDAKSNNMTVVVIPEERPKIEGDVRAHYAVGNTVNLTCIAAPSIPAAELRYLINDKEADEDYVYHYPVEKYGDGLLVSRLGLNFQLEKKDFVDGKLKIKCTANIPTPYWASDEQSHQEPTALTTEVLELTTEESEMEPGGAPRCDLGALLIVALVSANFLG